MGDDAVPISFGRKSTDASPAATTTTTAAAVPSRRPASPVDGRSHDRTPVFRELPRQGSQSSLNIDLLRDVELTVKIELGRTRMRLRDVLELGAGAVIELDRLAGDPVDVFVNDRLVARGEVVVIDEKFAVRLTEVAAPINHDE